MAQGRNEMDPPLCGTTAMSHNEFQISEPIEPQEVSPFHYDPFEGTGKNPLYGAMDTMSQRES
jgi:hypothetical protein